MYGGYGNGWGNGNNGNCNGNNAVIQGENFLAHLITNDDRHNGEHHILNRLSQIQSDIPTAEGAIQSAISAAQNSLSAQLYGGNISLQSQASTYALNEQNLAAQYALGAQNTAAQNALAAADQTSNTQLQAAQINAGTIAAITQARYDTNTQVRDVGTQVNAGTLFNSQQFGHLSTQAAVNTGVLNAAIIADGDRTRALINQNYIETLNRQLSTAQNEIIELRGDRNSISRHHETEVRVNQNVNQQQQQQQQQVQLGAILGRLEGLVQVAHATNQNVIAGNTGAVQTGAQTANPTNVRI
jgi:hypothetical protein